MTGIESIVSVALYVLINQPIDTQKHLHHPSRPQRVAKAVVRDVIGPAGSMRLYSDSSLRTYVYQFEGVATHRGEACRNASVTVRVVTSRGTFFQGGMTDSEGKYSIHITVEGNRFEPVDWSMEAYTSDFERVQLVGSRIMMQEDQDTTVRNEVDFKEVPPFQQPG